MVFAEVPRSRRFVVKEHVPRDQISVAAWDNRWIWLEEYEADDDRPYEKVWTTLDHQSSIHYIEDFVIGVRYLYVSNAQNDVIRQVISSIPVYTNDEVKQMAETAAGADGDAQGQIRAVYHLALTATRRSDAYVLDAIASALSNPTPEVRQAAILAVGYVGWPEFRVPLESLRRDDPDVDVRSDAKAMLEAMEELEHRRKRAGP
jgi:hypothetical protein